MRAACAALLVCAGCAATSGRVRFADRPVVWAVNDRADIPRPSKRTYLKDTDYYDQVVLHQVTRWLALPDRHPAADINALDEVPDSTWFINRIGRRDLDPAEIERGPESDHDPMAFKPWTVVSSKVGGTEVGFIIEDRAGVRYVLKFDSPGFPEQETGAHLVVSRVLWACGYRVPDDRLVHFEPGELILGPRSKVVDEFGHSRRMTAADLAKGLAGVNRRPGAPIRALTSRFVPGKVVGGFAPTGRRSDDANDRVPHQDRRELRGLEPIVAWLGHTDIKEGNTIDTWVPDAGDPNVHYLVHYLIDFGKALGNMAEIGRNVRSGFAYRFDWGYALRSFFTLGLYPNQWDRLRAPKLRGVGLFEIAGLRSVHLRAQPAVRALLRHGSCRRLLGRQADDALFAGGRARGRGCSRLQRSSLRQLSGAHADRPAAQDRALLVRAHHACRPAGRRDHAVRGSRLLLGSDAALRARRRAAAGLPARRPRLRRAAAAGPGAAADRRRRPRLLAVDRAAALTRRLFHPDHPQAGRR